MTRRLGPLVTLGVCLALTSCSGSSIQKTYPVTGKVLLDGAPVAGATVVLHPTDKSKFKMDERPQARTGADGRFTVFTYKEGDGAPEGTYQVAIAFVQTGEDGGDQVRRAKAAPIPAKYGVQSTSGLTATVKAGPTTLEPFQLTGK